MDLPREFLQRMAPLLGDNMTAFQEAYTAPLRRGLRVNSAVISPKDFTALFPLPLQPSPFSPDSFYLDAPHKAGSDPLHHAGGYYMQEPSASSAVTVLNPHRDEKILDLCAAPGGKSGQIAAALGDTGLLWSHEYVPSRAQILRQNLERLGVRRHVITTGETSRLCEALPDFFDAILVDAPCSGEGMFRKEPQALTEWSPDNIQLCAARQATVLDNAAIALRPGGRMVYSTCTFAPEENEATVAAFLHRHPDFTLEPIVVEWGQPGYSFDEIKAFATVEYCTADLRYCRRIFPHQGGEGHFIALLRRQADAIAAPPPITPLPCDKNAAAAAALYADCFYAPPEGAFFTSGDTVRLLPPELPSLKGLPILCAGIPIAQICKNRLEPCHGAFAATVLANCRHKIEFHLHDPQLIAFLQGQELSLSDGKGWTAVGVAGLTAGFGKNTGGKLKNRYPKGLRLL